MPSTYYDIALGADGALTSAASAAAPNPMPAEVEALLARLRSLIDRIRLRIPEGATRTAYANYALGVGRTGLQDGNIAGANQELDQIDAIGLNVQYYVPSLDQDNNLHVAQPPWAPHDMPDDVVALTNEIDSTIAKVKRLLGAPGDEQKRNRYLRTLLSYAQHGLADGDVKSATTALDQFKQQFVDEEGPHFRAKYVASTLWMAITVFVGAVLLGIIYNATSSSSWPTYLSFLRLEENFLPTALCVVIGICLGVSFFAFVRNLNLSFDTLGHFDPANLNPVLRFSLVAIIAGILGILLKVGLVKINVAGVQLDAFMDKGNGLIAVVLGMICGYSDIAITKTLTGVLDRNAP